MGSNKEEDNNWDLERYKTEHECEEHWELRRKFLMTHKDKFSEEELLCLAQVFINVELLGCRYPRETMQRIAELTKDVAADYRERQKTKLKRTFVKASDAATSKVKGVSKNCKIDSNPTKRNFQEEDDEGGQGGGTDAMEDRAKPPEAKKLKVSNGPFSELVLVEHFGTSNNHVTVMECSTRYAGMSLDFEYQIVQNNVKCTIFLNRVKVAESTATSKKLARKEVADAAMKILKKQCYTIKIKKQLNPNVDFSQNPATQEGVGDPGNVTSSNEQQQQHSKDEKSAPSSGRTEGALQVNSKIKLTEDNIGMKLMKLMGWSGGGLGKEQQGIIEPISVSRHLSRKGLGLKAGENSIQNLKRKCRELIKEFLTDLSKPDLVFSTEFSNEERAVIHQIARNLGAKSRSYGPKDGRTLIIYRSINPLELVTELLNLGGSTDNCYRWADRRRLLEMNGGPVTPDNVIARMLRDKDSWTEMTTYVTDVLKTKKDDGCLEDG